MLMKVVLIFILLIARAYVIIYVVRYMLKFKEKIRLIIDNIVVLLKFFFNFNKYLPCMHNYVFSYPHNSFVFTCTYIYLFLYKITSSIWYNTGNIESQLLY